MPRDNRFLPPVDDDPESAEAPAEDDKRWVDPGQDMAIDRYSGSHMNELLQGNTGAYRGLHGTGDWQAGGDEALQLDSDVLDKVRGRRGTVHPGAPTGTAPGDVGRGAPKAGGRKRDHASTHAPARPKRPSLAAIAVEKPKTGVFMVAVLFLGLGGGFILWRHLSERAAIAEVRAPIDALAEARGPLYDRLLAEATSGARVEDNYCPRLGSAAEDARFTFDGAPYAALPPATRAARERQRFEQLLDDGRPLGDLGAEFADIADIGSAVVQVRVLDWRAPGSGGSGSGYVLGDAYVGNAETGGIVCSFRFFATGSDRLPSGSGPQGNLLDRTYRAIDNAMRGIRSTPGITGGRYQGASAPTGI